MSETRQRDARSTQSETRRLQFDLSTIMGIHVEQVIIVKDIQKKAYEYVSLLKKNYDEKSMAEFAWAFRLKLQREMRASLIKLNKIQVDSIVDEGDVYDVDFGDEEHDKDVSENGDDGVVNHTTDKEKCIQIFNEDSSLQTSTPSTKNFSKTVI